MSHKTGNLAIRILLVALVALVGSSSARQRREQPTRATQRATSIDYSKFSHATKRHQVKCDSCHKIPTKNWKQVSDYPDVVDYPDHVACVSCHRQQFFKGVKPVICTVCHSKVSPRDDDRMTFRNPTVMLQFRIEFPHDKHQDVIANANPGTKTRNVFDHTRLSRSSDDKPQAYNNCSICHSVLSSLELSPPSNGWIDGFVPPALTFKAAPTTHGSCFNCHWKGQEPVAANCNGCHKLADPYGPRNVPTRISMKFVHEGGGEKKNHIAECTTCHINITKAATLRGLKPDVPITSCTECHNKDGLRQDVSKELAAIDKNRDFNCSYCHTSNVGKLDPPPSHYLIARRTPLKRKDIK